VGLLLDDLEDAAAWFLPRGAALRRLAAEARSESEARYGRAVEQSRDGFSRAYEEHFRGLLAAFDAAARQTAGSVEAALSAAEERARALEAGTAEAAPSHLARRSALLELWATLCRMERGAAEAGTSVEPA